MALGTTYTLPDLLALTMPRPLRSIRIDFLRNGNASVVCESRASREIVWMRDVSPRIAQAALAYATSQASRVSIFDAPIIRDVAMA